MERTKVDLLKVDVALTRELVFGREAAGEADFSGHDAVEACGLAFEVSVGERQIFERQFDRVGLRVGVKVCCDGDGSVSCGQGEFLELDVGAFEGEGRLPRSGSEGSKHLG